MYLRADKMFMHYVSFIKNFMYLHSFSIIFIVSEMLTLMEDKRTYHSTQYRLLKTCDKTITDNVSWNVQDDPDIIFYYYP